MLMVFRNFFSGGLNSLVESEDKVLRVGMEVVEDAYWTLAAGAEGMADLDEGRKANRDGSCDGTCCRFSDNCEFATMGLRALDGGRGGNAEFGGPYGGVAIVGRGRIDAMT